MKRMIVTALALGILFSGCKGALGEDSSSRGKIPEIKIGVAVYREDDTFIETIVDNIEKLAKETETKDKVKITVNVVDGKGTQATQNDQVDKFLAQGYDVICVNMVDRTASATIIDKAKNAGIPVIFFNREPVEEDMQRWDKLYYVGSIPAESGTMQGNIVVDAYNADPEKADKNGDGKLQYVMLEGEPGHQDALIRTEYAVKTVTRKGIKLEKLASDTANWQRAQGATRMTQWLEQEFGGKIEVVFSNNDDMALGAIDALEAAGTEELPIIVGVDGTPPALRAIQDGTLTGTVVNDSKKQAESIFKLAYALANGTPLEDVPELSQGKYIRTPHRQVTIGNVAEELEIE